jgi:hypothetical protein
MSTVKKTAAKAVTPKKVKVSKDLLRNASTGAFSEGTAPTGKTPSGTRGGVPFWEV